MKLYTLVTLPMFFICNFSMAQTDLIFKASFEYPKQKLNDTGITWAGENLGNNTGCTSTTITSPQDCNIGRDTMFNDSIDGHAGFSFTKLDVSGVPLTDQSVNYETEPWACVYDNVTELVWEVKSDDGSIHDKDNTYRWGGITAIGLEHTNAEGIYYSDWDILVNGSNAGDGLCGYNNWRVPTVAELSTIVNKDTFNPAIDTKYFPNTVLEWFWSSSPIVNDANSAWIIHYIFGYSTFNHRGHNGHVRLVRSLRH